jgi:uncharacterized damage-inducible protein DinB
MAKALDSSSPDYYKVAPSTATPEERPEIVSLYRQLAPAVESAIEGLSEDQMRFFPIPGTWSIHQIVLHLTDAELVFADRFKRFIADEDPQLAPFDENRWMAHLAPTSRQAKHAAKLLTLARQDISALLATLPPEQFQRKGAHPQMGTITLLAHLKRANWHLEHHLKFIHQKRALLTSTTSNK